MTTATETLRTAVEKSGVKYTAEFVPFSKSRSASKKPTKPSEYSLNWKVTVSKGSRSITTDYSAGIAHIPGYKQSFSGRLSVDEFDGIKRACETGKASHKPIPAPEMHDVVYALVRDAEAIYFANFEEWANEFGYETDSRAAEKIYNQCRDIGLQLRAMLGDDGLKALQTAAQEY